MANTKDKANDHQEEKKVELIDKITPSEAAIDENESSKEIKIDKSTLKEILPEYQSDKSDNSNKQVDDISEMNLTELVKQFKKRIKAEDLFSNGKVINNIIHVFETKFKLEIQKNKEIFVNEGGNEIDFFFKPTYKDEFDRALVEYKKNKRTYFQEREQMQKLNLDRKLEIIESLKDLINIDENINTIYKKFKNLQESWHKTGAVPRAHSNNIWQTYKHHTEIFYDFLHLNRELRDLDFKHNYEEKIKIIKQAESLSEIPDVLRASRDLNTLHRLWKNDLGPVAKEHSEELWARFQSASQIIHSRRQDFDKEYDKILEENLNKKNSILEKMEEIKNNPPENHNNWRITIAQFNKMRNEFQSIGQVTKNHSKVCWTRFREISREINRQKNQFYKTQKAEQKKNIDLKKSLINEVKEILEYDDWRSYSNRMKNIQKDWRAIGFVPRRLSNNLWEEFRSQCNTYFDRIKSGFKKINKKEVKANKEKEEFIKRIEGLQIPPELEPFKEFFEYQWREYNLLGNLTGNSNLNSIEAFNEVFFSMVDQSKMEENIKSDAKNHIRFTTTQNDENKISRKIQKIKKVIEQLNSEARQLENNLDYFSNTSSNSHLFDDVTNQLEKLKSEIEKHQEELIGFRKLKRDIEANKAFVEEELMKNDDDEEKTDS